MGTVISVTSGKGGTGKTSITGGVEDMSQYDTVLFAYPIWHGQARKC